MGLALVPALVSQWVLWVLFWNLLKNADERCWYRGWRRCYEWLRPSKKQLTPKQRYRAMIHRNRRIQ